MELNGKNISPEKKNMLLFMMLIKQHDEIARMNLGEIPNPATNLKEVDIKSARFAIDTLEMIEIYTKGNLGNEAQTYLNHILSSLKTKLAEASENG